MHSPNPIRLSVILALLALAAVPYGEAAIYLVRPDGTGDFPTIQAAINASVNGDEILLADGVFSGPGNRDMSYGGRAITIRSQTGNAVACIIDLTDPFAGHRAFQFYSEGSNSILRNVTIRDGLSSSGGAVYMVNASPTFSQCYFVNCSVSGNGGAAYVYGGSPVFSYCYFEYCEASEGGGAYVANTPIEVTFYGGGFLDNDADSGAGLMVGPGGDVLMGNCTFMRNVATVTGGGIYSRGPADLRLEEVSIEYCDAPTGGAIFIDNTSMTLRRSWVLGNGASSNAAGLWCQNGSVPRLEWVVLAGNYTPGVGGGMHCWGSAPVVRNSTFYDNAAGDGGCGISLEACGLTLLNSIIAYGAEGEAVSCSQPGAIQISCTDIYGNQGGNWAGCISSFQNINGNIRLDPQFCNAGGGDLTIRSSSPCMPYSPPNTQCDLIGAKGVGCPVGSADEDASTDEGFRALRVDPNPFRSETRIDFTPPGTGPVRIAIVETTGRLVRELHSGSAPDGNLRLVWDGRNDAGVPVAAGVYLVRADSPTGSIARSVIVLR